MQWLTSTLGTIIGKKLMMAVTGVSFADFLLAHLAGNPTLYGGADLFNSYAAHLLIVVGTGLAGGAAAATLAELGYNVKSFCIQDSPRQAHSIAAQGGINAAKNYPNDGDSISIRRLFYDTIKGGDFRAREANVYRLAQVSNNIPKPARQFAPRKSRSSTSPGSIANSSRPAWLLQTNKFRPPVCCCTGLRHNAGQPALCGLPIP